MQTARERGQFNSAREPFGTLSVSEGPFFKSNTMTSTRFIMRLMIGELGDRTIPSAFRAEKPVADASNAYCRRQKWVLHFLKMLSISVTRIPVFFRKVVGTAARTFGPLPDGEQGGYCEPRSSEKGVTAKAKPDDRVFLRPRPFANPLIARWRFLERAAQIEPLE